MAPLGIANSRMKDFYDVAVLARDFDFDGGLTRAIRATFERRKTALPTTAPVALTPAFAEDPTKKTQWSGFVRKAGVHDAGSLAETIASVRAFVEEPLVSAVKALLRRARGERAARGCETSPRTTDLPAALPM